MSLGEFKRAGHWPTLLCSLLYFDTSFMVWTLMGALGVFIAQAFHLTPAQKGLLVAIPLLGGSILRIIMGVATDHFGPPGGWFEAGRGLLLQPVSNRSDQQRASEAWRFPGSPPGSGGDVMANRYGAVMHQY